MNRRKHRNKKKWLWLLAFAVFFIVILSPTFFLDLIRDKKISQPITLSKNIERYYVPISHFTDSTDNLSFDEIIAEYRNPQKETYLGKDDEAPVKKLLGLEQISDRVRIVEDDKVVDTVSETAGRFAIVPYYRVRANTKSLSVDHQYLWDKPEEYALKTSVKQNNNEPVYDKNRVILLSNIGDVILGRHVAKKMKEYGDYNHPWLKMAEIIRKSDIAFADLECPLSDLTEPPDEGMSFIAPTAAVSGFKLAGIDIVGLANNHSTNFGGLPDTLNTLKRAGIKYVGGGDNEDEAYAPAYIEKDGVKFGFVDFNSIIGAINASGDTSGIAKFDIAPWSKTDNQDDIERIKKIIREAGSSADVVVAQFHWGVEYESDPIQSQINVAHAAIEAGADLIIGTHPHTVQGMEYYRNIPVLYSLGNFIFDQEWSIPTKQGTLAESFFYDKQLVAIRLIPYQIEDYNQPALANSSQKKEILNRIYESSVSNEYQH